MYNHGLYGCYYGFRAIILHTFGVQVAIAPTLWDPGVTKRFG